MNGSEKPLPSISIQAVQRMPSYLQYLKHIRADGIETISSAKAAAHFGLSEIQVRKDFASVSPSSGKPKAGFSINSLIDSIEQYLGFRNTNEAVLTGVGSLGRALLSYDGFDAYGLSIVAAFDCDTIKIGTDINSKPILPSDEIDRVCHRMNINIGIITVPAEHAQYVCNQYVSGGVRAIWNFAPVHLCVPKGILVQNENMAVSLAMLSKHLRETLR